METKERGYVKTFDVWKYLIGCHDKKEFEEQAELIDICIIVSVVSQKYWKYYRDYVVLCCIQ